MHEALKFIGVIVGLVLIGYGLNQTGGSAISSILIGILFVLSPLELLGGFTVYFVVIGAFLAIMIGGMALGAFLIGGKLGVFLGFAAGAYGFYRLTDLIGASGASKKDGH